MKLNELICLAKMFALAKTDESPESVKVVQFRTELKTGKPIMVLNNGQFTRLFNEEDYSVERLLDKDGNVVHYTRSIDIDGCKVEGIAWHSELTLKDRTILGLPGEDF